MELEPAVFTDSVTCYWRWFALLPFVGVRGRYSHCIRFFAIGPLTTVASCITTAYYHFSEDYSNFPAAHYTIMTFGFLFREFLPLYSCYLVCYKSVELKLLFENLEEVGKTLTRCNNAFNIATPKWNYACHIAYILLSLMYELSVNSSRYLLILSFYVGRFLWTFNVLQLVDLLNLFKAYFAALEILVNSECSAVQFRRLVNIYDRLCFLVSTFEQLFGFGLLLAFSHLFVFNVSFIYLNVERQLFPSVSWEITVLTFVTLPVFIIQLVRPCSQTTNSVSTNLIIITISTRSE